MPRISVCLAFVALCLAAATTNAIGFDVKELDRSVSPADDFYMFVNGRWLNKTTIPSSQSAWGVYTEIDYENQFQFKTILDDLIANENITANYTDGSVERLLADVYRAGLDVEAIELAGIEPLREALLQLEQVEDYLSLIAFSLKWYKEMNQGILFNFAIRPDANASRTNVAHFVAAGNELRDREFYFTNDPHSQEIRRSYTHYIHQMLTLSDRVLGLNSTYRDAEDVLSLGTQLAVTLPSNSVLDDPVVESNRYDRKRLQMKMPSLAWDQVLSMLNIENETIIISAADYYRFLNKLIISQPLRIWKNKIRFTILHRLAPFLSDEYLDTRFTLFDQVINGQKDRNARWMLTVKMINDYIPDSLGQLYAAKHYPEKKKTHFRSLVDSIVEAFADRIAKLTWLSQPTKERALKKLKAMDKKLGYPEKWGTFSTLRVNRSSYFESVRKIFRYSYEQNIQRLGMKVDRQRWSLTAQTTEAYYRGDYNDITFPVATIQEPFFSVDYDDALNYGGIGSLIGHEMTHGFDNDRRFYDEQGNIRPWWTEHDLKEFDARALKLIEQFNKYEILNTTVNGNLTLDENISDLGGIEIAYEAFSKTKQAKERIPIDGLTPDQRFFIAFARVWRTKRTEERQLTDLKASPHSPGIFRINGPLSNMDSFYRTFNVTKGNALYREEQDRVHIW